ncbi:tyrosine-type recombinase/integrase [Nitrobacter sp. JJSN]|uniref:tyrosine-type recombinase/integrase n=1 Tax=Nitrobacter sp. JJSN TaxID=3453033 RepID=UPI003F7658BE
MVKSAAQAAVTGEDGTPGISRSAAEKIEFTKARLDELLRNGRPQRQKAIWDTKQDGLCVLVSRGPKHKRQATLTFRVAYYLTDHPGKPRYVSLGRYPDAFPTFNIEDVRAAAANIRSQARQGSDPRKPKLKTDGFKETVDLFISDHLKTTRTYAEAVRILHCYVLPEWADKKTEDITKTDVKALLTKIACGQIKSIDKQGKSVRLGTPAMARATRTQLQSLFNWYVDEYGTDAFRSPIVKSRKTKEWRPADRERVLTDDEIRAMWIACEDMGAYGAAVQSALLMAQRFRKVGNMRRCDLKDHIRIQGHMEAGQWIEDQDIGHVWDAARPNDPKNKQVSAVPLPPLAREIIAGVPIPDVDRGKAEDFVFTTTGTGPLKGWSKYKARLDRKILASLRQWAKQRGDDPEQVTFDPWQHRDLRRTARTLMARIGVDDRVAELCLGHIQPGVEKIYNRYTYLSEKREAFAKLADFVDRIVNPPKDNVVPLRRQEEER